MKPGDEAALRALGHWDIGVVRKEAGGFYVLCDCGYRSTHRNTMKDSIQTAMHHRSKMLGDFRKNGVSLPAVARKAR
jgi:hypothetical protein